MTKSVIIENKRKLLYFLLTLCVKVTVFVAKIVTFDIAKDIRLPFPCSRLKKNRVCKQSNKQSSTESKQSKNRVVNRVNRVVNRVTEYRYQFRA